MFVAVKPGTMLNGATRAPAAGGAPAAPQGAAPRPAKGGARGNKQPSAQAPPQIMADAAGMEQE
jgi:hypothetical protein